MLEHRFVAAFLACLMVFMLTTPVWAQDAYTATLEGRAAGRGEGLPRHRRRGESRLDVKLAFLCDAAGHGSGGRILALGKGQNL